VKACIFHGPGRLAVESRAEPSPGPGEILLRMEAAGVCYSDIRVYRGEKHARPGVIPGHEIVGRVEALGEGADGFAAGQRVAVCPIIACGRCYYCVHERGVVSPDLPKCSACGKVISGSEWQVMTQGKHYHNRCEPNKGVA